MATVTSILSDISSLTPIQVEELYESLTRIIQPSQSQQGSLIGELRETKFKSGFHCRHCGSVDVIRYGKRDGRQRYKCKDCERMSSDLTHTPLYRSKKAQQWIRFVECMLKGLSLRKTAELIGVHYVTCFYWRHKLLSALTKEQIHAFQGLSKWMKHTSWNLLKEETK